MLAVLRSCTSVVSEDVITALRVQSPSWGNFPTLTLLTLTWVCYVDFNEDYRSPGVSRVNPHRDLGSINVPACSYSICRTIPVNPLMTHESLPSPEIQGDSTQAAPFWCGERSSCSLIRMADRRFLERGVYPAVLAVFAVGENSRPGGP